MEEVRCCNNCFSRLVKFEDNAYYGIRDYGNETPIETLCSRDKNIKKKPIKNPDKSYCDKWWNPHIRPLDYEKLVNEIKELKLENNILYDSVLNFKDKLKNMNLSKHERKNISGGHSFSKFHDEDIDRIFNECLDKATEDNKCT